MSFELWQICAGILVIAIIGTGAWLVQSGKLESLFEKSTTARIERDIRRKLDDIAKAQTSQSDEKDDARRRIHKLETEITAKQKERKLLLERLDANSARDETRIQEMRAELEELRTKEAALKQESPPKTPTSYTVGEDGVMIFTSGRKFNEPNNESKYSDQITN